MKKMALGTIKKLFIFGILCISMTSFIACGKKNVSIDKDKIENLTLPNEKDDYVNIKLYFDNSKDTDNEDILGEERVISKEELLGELIVQELIKGPSIKSELSPIIPKDARLISFCIKDNVAIINLTEEAVVSMDKSKEKVSLKCIAKALEQLPSVEKVQILIENKNVESLGGNYDISIPFSESDIKEVMN